MFLNIWNIYKVSWKRSFPTTRTDSLSVFPHLPSQFLMPHSRKHRTNPPPQNCPPPDRLDTEQRAYESTEYNLVLQHSHASDLHLNLISVIQKRLRDHECSNSSRGPSHDSSPGWNRCPLAHPRQNFRRHEYHVTARPKSDFLPHLPIDSRDEFWIGYRGKYGRRDKNWSDGSEFVEGFREEKLTTCLRRELVESTGEVVAGRVA